MAKVRKQLALFCYASLNLSSEDRNSNLVSTVLADPRFYIGAQ
jgi:hypothetical protein